MSPTIRSVRPTPLPAAARKVASKLTRTGISPETRREIKRLVSRDAVTRTSASEIARAIAPKLGVNWPQMQTARSLRLALENAGVPERTIERRLAALERRQIKARALTIAECEISRQRADLRMADIERDAEPGDQVEWITTGSMRRPKSKAAAKRTGPCWLCRQMAGKRVRVGQNFLLPDGRRLKTAPAHPHCACLVLKVSR